MKQKTKNIHTSNYKGKTSPYYSVMPPVVHASTIAFSNFDELVNIPDTKITYGRYGVEPMTTFRQAICELENATNAIITSSGVQAISTAILGSVKAGDHILIPDGVYLPARGFCDDVLEQFGVQVTYYNPNDMEDLESLIQKNTTAIFVETPNSLTMEMPDIDGIIKMAKKHALISIIDNTWGAGYFFKPLDVGYDIVIQAATKYITGHSDTMIGTIATNDKDMYKNLALMAKRLGIAVAPDDIYLALRGLKTMSIRLTQQEKNTLEVIDFIKNHPLVDDVFSPNLSTNTGHHHWKKHFTGICGLFSFTFKKDYNNDEMAKFYDALTLFIMGYSWGGFESIISIADPVRTHTPWTKNRIIRLHIGLEDTHDLINDLSQAMENLK